MSLYCNGDNSHLFVNRKEIFKFKANNENVNFPTRFCLESISNGFDPAEQPILAKKIYDIRKFQIFKKITIFRNISKFRRLCLDCIRHFNARPHKATFFLAASLTLVLAVMPTHPHQAGVTLSPILKSSPACQKGYIFTQIFTFTSRQQQNITTNTP